MNEKTTVIYHSADFDGLFCREIARKFLPRAQLIGWDYGNPVPEIPPGVDVLYMLDISIEGLMSHPKLVWIDHHFSAMEKFHHGIPGYRIDGVAACRLAWQWFTRLPATGELAMKEEFVNRTVFEPWSVRLAGEYDIWDKRDPDAELFQHGLRSRELSSQDWFWMLEYNQKPSIEEVERLISVGAKDILSPDGTTPNPIVVGLLKDGKVLQYAKTEENKSIIQSAGFDLHFEGLKFLACNHARYNSFLFTDGLRDDHDACLGFAWRAGKWTVSLYHAPGNEHHDLSAIAKKYGGGGHRGACGFTCTELPFQLN